MATGTKPKGRSKKAAAAPFGRTATADGTLTDLGCPDCRGVLTVNDPGNMGFLQFRCRVGHVFSMESLLPLKEDVLEGALWIAIELCEEIASLNAHLASRGTRGERDELVGARRKRAKGAVAQARALRAILGEHDAPDRGHR